MLGCRLTGFLNSCLVSGKDYKCYKYTTCTSVSSLLATQSLQFTANVKTRRVDVGENQNEINNFQLPEIKNLIVYSKNESIL